MNNVDVFDLTERCKDLSGLRALSMVVRQGGVKRMLLRTLVAASSAKTASFGMPSFEPKWRTTVDEDGHYCFAVAL
jgi:hypothetical protein